MSRFFERLGECLKEIHTGPIACQPERNRYVLVSAGEMPTLFHERPRDHEDVFYNRYIYVMEDEGNTKTSVRVCIHGFFPICLSKHKIEEAYGLVGKCNGKHLGPWCHFSLNDKSGKLIAETYLFLSKYKINKDLLIKRFCMMDIFMDRNLKDVIALLSKEESMLNRASDRRHTDKKSNAARNKSKPVEVEEEKKAQIKLKEIQSKLQSQYATKGIQAYNLERPDEGGNHQQSAGNDSSSGGEEKNEKI